MPDRMPERMAVEVVVRIGVLAVFAYVAWTLVKPFVPVLLWSAVLTVAFYPAFEWLRDRLGGRSWLAALTLTAIAVAITAGPTTFLLTSLVHSFEALAHRIGRPPYVLPPLPKEVADLPVVGPEVARRWTLAAANLQDFFGRYSKVLIGAGEWALHAAAGLAASVATLFAAVIVTGFLFTPAPRLNVAIRAFAAKVTGEHGGAFVDLAGATIRTVARGVVGVALIQAVLIGVALMVAEVPAAGLLTLAALVLCTLQVGAFPIVIPILIWAWVVRDSGQALLLSAWLVPAALSDTVLKPMMMGKGLTTPIVVLLMGVVGGTLAYGLTGMFLGPVVLAVFYDLLLFWLAPRPEAPPGPTPGE